jgi:Kef-type K+ transport system membrane component KefB
VRGAFALLAALTAAAAELGLELILGAFLAGATLALVDRDRAMTHPDLRRRLGTIGFGVFVPAFFVTSGLRFDLDALTSDAATLARVPLYLACLLLVRGLPALLYRRLVGTSDAIAAGLLQATSLAFIVAATSVGVELGAVGTADAAALVGAGLLSVLLFPAAALGLLDRAAAART